jgi:hypothetical protein
MTKTVVLSVHVTWMRVDGLGGIMGFLEINRGL